MQKRYNIINQNQLRTTENLSKKVAQTRQTICLEEGLHV